MRGPAGVFRILYSFVLILSASVFLYAEKAVGPDFLLVKPHARTAAMGNSFTGLADDANAMIFNPAGISFQEKNDLSFTHYLSFADTNYEYIMYTSPQKTWGFGAGIMCDYTLDFPNIDQAGTDLGQVVNYDFMVSAAAGLIIFPGFSAGMTAKFFRSTLLNYSKEGFAFDLGVLFKAMEDPDVYLGLVLLNAGSQNAYETEADLLPLELKLGVGVKHIINEIISLAAAADLGRVMVNKYMPEIGGGIEMCFYSMFYASAGFGFKQEGDYISFGAGIKPLENLKITYAFQPFLYLGITHRFSLDLYI